MNFRLTAVLFGVVSLALIGLLVAVLRDDPDEAAVKAGGVADPLTRAGVREADVDTLELVRTEPTEQTLVFTKTDGNWIQVSPTTARLDSNTVAGLVRDLLRLRPIDYAERTDNLALAGLSPPSARITLKAGGQQLTFNLGRTTVGGDRAVTFVTTSARPNSILAVSRSSLANVFKASLAGGPGDGLAWTLMKWLPDFRRTRLLGADLRDAATEATALSLTAGASQLALARTADGWVFTTPAGFGPADVVGDSAPRAPGGAYAGVRPLLGELTRLTVTNPADYLEPAADLIPLGLTATDPTAMRVELTGPTGTETLTIGKPVLDAEGKPVSPAQVYVRLDDGAVAKVPFEGAEALRATVAAPAELRSRDLILAADRNKLDAIDLTADGQTIQLRKVNVLGDNGSAPVWVVYGGPGGPVFARSPLVTQLLDTLTRPRAAGEPLSTPADAALAEPAVRATLKAWTNAVALTPDDQLKPGEPPTEPTVAAPPALTLLIGATEGERTVVRRTRAGTQADFQLSGGLPALATTPRLGWVDPRFGSFNRAKAARITFNRADVPFDVEKVNETWVFAAPPELKGQAADAEQVVATLDQLAALTPEQVLVEQPTPEQLAEYGLAAANPRLRVTVAVQDDVAKTRTYDFGTDTADGRAIHARQPEMAFVVRTDRRPLDALAGAALRDQVLYRLDPTQVTKIRLRGWKGTSGPDPVIVQLEKQGETWSTPTPGLDLDPAKVQSLLAAIAAPRAEAFVGPGEPLHGTDVTVNPTAVELIFDRTDGPPIALVFGAAADANRVYAASSTNPGTTVLLNPAAVKPLLATPTSLAR